MSRRGQRWPCRLLVVVLAWSFALTYALGTAPSAHAHSANVVTLGGVNLAAYCQAQSSTVGTFGAGNYYDWRCEDRHGDRSRINMHDACRWQYNNANALDYTDNFYRLTGGVCLLATVAGGIDARGFCRSQGYDDVQLQGSTAYDWRCLYRDRRIAYTFNINQACQWMYSNSQALARFDNFYIPTSWQCLV